MTVQLIYQAKLCFLSNSRVPHLGGACLSMAPGKIQSKLASTTFESE
jgi:hypothetical protein